MRKTVRKSACNILHLEVGNAPMKVLYKLSLICSAVLLGTLFFGIISLDAAAASSFSVSDTRFEAPKDWKKVPSASTMRRAQFAVEFKGVPEKGEVVFYYFGPGGAGGTKANVQRWFRQFKEPETQLETRLETIKVNNIPVTLVKATGTYMSGSPAGPKVPKPQFSLLAAILEAPKGHIFIKFTGPRDLVDNAEKGFRSMVKSALVSE